MRSVLIFLTEISMFATILLKPSHSATTVVNTGNAFRFFQGITVTCDREGEIINTTISDSQCFKCICRNGIPDCKQKVCADLSTCPLKEPKKHGECCERCKTCNYVGQTYENNDQWFSDQDPCRRLACKSGIVTEGTIECIVPCPNPIRKPGICCPLCSSEDIVDFSLKHNPCVKCICQRFTSWYNNPLSFVASHEISDEKKYCYCFRAPCPVLDCPKEHTYRPEGSCCEECKTTQLVEHARGDDCVFRGDRMKNSQIFRPDICAFCICSEGTVQCRKFMCKLQNCTASRIYYRPDLCCPLCLDRDPLPCTYQNREFKHGHSWSVNSCTKCSCSNSQISCTTTQCPFERGCPRGYKMVSAPEGKCCATCKEYEATCTVYGDPHYQTFDGRQYNFQGSCKYILTKKCGGTSPGEFSVIVKNEPLGYNWSTWTRQVAIRLPNYRIVFLPGKRIKMNHTLITRIPYIELGKFSITFDRHKNLAFNYVHGLKVKWDGNSYVEVIVSQVHRKHMCGLCGNYNGDPLDDFQLQSIQPWRHANSKNTVVGDADVFARSWRTGSWEKCRNPADRTLHQVEDRAKRKYRRQMAQLRRAKYGRVDHDDYRPPSPIFESPRPKFSDVISSPSILTMTNFAIAKRKPSLDYFAAPVKNKKKFTLPQLPNANLWNVLLNRLKVKRDKMDYPTESVVFDSLTPPSTMMNDDSKSKIDAKKAKKRRPKRRRRRNLARKMCRKYAEPKRWNAALKNCKLLKSKLFDQCHEHVDFKSFYNSCIMDVCSCQPFAKCYCGSLSAYNAQCENRNVTVTWKDVECSETNGRCTVEGSVFELCPSICEPLTCENFRNSTIKACHENLPRKFGVTMSSICNPSCRCPRGKVISRRENKCVDENKC